MIKKDENWMNFGFDGLRYQVLKLKDFYYNIGGLWLNKISNSGTKPHGKERFWPLWSLAMVRSEGHVWSKQ